MAGVWVLWGEANSGFCKQREVFSVLRAGEAPGNIADDDHRVVRGASTVVEITWYWAAGRGGGMGWSAKVGSIGGDSVLTVQRS